MGEHSGSEAGASHRSQDDEEEDDNLSEDLEDDNEKDEGMRATTRGRLRRPLDTSGHLLYIDWRHRVIYRPR